VDDSRIDYVEDTDTGIFGTEMASASLYSTAPIEVLVNGVPSFFDVFVELSGAGLVPDAPIPGSVQLPPGVSLVPGSSAVVASSSCDVHARFTFADAITGVAVGRPSKQTFPQPSREQPADRPRERREHGRADRAGPGRIDGGAVHLCQRGRRAGPADEVIDRAPVASKAPTGLPQESVPLIWSDRDRRHVARSSHRERNAGRPGRDVPTAGRFPPREGAAYATISVGFHRSPYPAWRSHEALPRTTIHLLGALLLALAPVAASAQADCCVIPFATSPNRRCRRFLGSRLRLRRTTEIVMACRWHHHPDHRLVRHFSSVVETSAAGWGARPATGRASSC